MSEATGRAREGRQGTLGRRAFAGRLLAGSAAAAGLGSMATAATSASASAAEIKAATAPPGGEVRHMSLYMEPLADGQMGYGLEPGKATIPGPLIEINEGDTLHIEVTNNLDVDASLHVHGLDYEVSSDGTTMNHSQIEPGGKRTYTWRTHAPGRRDDGTYRAGSAGYWHYHDHVVGTEHGSGGIRAGLYGPVIVRRKGDILPDVTHTIVFNDMKINNALPGPDFEATVGDRVEIVMITHGEYFHTFHIHGHRWADNRTGLLTGPDDPSPVIDNKTVGPADSFGFQVIAGEGVGAGAWMYHCHVQSHSDQGMVGLFLVKNEDGSIPDYEHMDHPTAGGPAKKGGSGKGTKAEKSGAASSDGKGSAGKGSSGKGSDGATGMEGMEGMDGMQGMEGMEGMEDMPGMEHMDHSA